MIKNLNADESWGMTRGERLLAEGLSYLLDCESGDGMELFSGEDGPVSDEYSGADKRFTAAYDMEDSCLSEAAEDEPSYGEDAE